MCKNCYNSPMGLERRQEQEEASLALKQQTFKGYEDPAYLAAYKRSVAAGKAMSQLHNDYVLAMARERVQAGVVEPYITHGDKRNG